MKLFVFINEINQNFTLYGKGTPCGCPDDILDSESGQPQGMPLRIIKKIKELYLLVYNKLLAISASSLRSPLIKLI